MNCPKNKNNDLEKAFKSVAACGTVNQDQIKCNHCTKIIEIHRTVFLKGTVAREKFSN